VITKSTMPREKRLAVDIEAMKGAYKRREVETIAVIRTDVNPADALTKVMDPKALMSI
jgi:isocitrate lyase